jgi:hypothetical protein
MRGILGWVCAATGSLLVVGCGTSPGHLSVSVGRHARLDLHRAASGHTSVQVALGAHDCLATRVDAAWSDVTARVLTC